MKEVKFTIQHILGIVLSLVVAGIGIVYGIDVVSDVRDDYSGGNATTAADTEFTAANNTMIGVSKFSDKFPTIGLVAVAAVIIGILVTYLGGRMMR